MDLGKEFSWNNSTEMTSRKFTCGYCGQPIASQMGYTGIYEYGGGYRKYAYIYICHFCSRPTFFDESGEQVPGTAFGNDVKDITDKVVNDLYNEARRCTSANAYTAAVLCCRKLLMHIAVAKGASENQPFSAYVSFLSDKGFIPPDAKSWVDHIRTKGNEANHEIKIMTRQDSEELLSFIEMLLQIIYEFPAIVSKRYPPKK